MSAVSLLDSLEKQEMRRLLPHHEARPIAVVGHTVSILDGELTPGEQARRKEAAK